MGTQCSETTAGGEGGLEWRYGELGWRDRGLVRPRGDWSRGTGDW
jgi:hypothetical protein